MRTLPLVVLATAAAAAYAYDAIKITPKYEVGQKTKWKTELKMMVGTTEAILSGTIVNKVASVSGDSVEIENDWESPKAVVGGQDMDVPFAATHYKVNSAGELQEVSGGIEGTDVPRTLLVGFANLPKEALEANGKWTATYPKNEKMDLLERKVEGTYLGEDEVGGKKVHKFKAKTTEGEFMSVLTYWTTLEGRVLKMEGQFENLPIPVAGENASGTLKADYVE